MICQKIDSFFHVKRGYRDRRIDYASLALFTRKALVEHIGIKPYRKDKVKVNKADVKTNQVQTIELGVEIGNENESDVESDSDFELEQMDVDESDEPVIDGDQEDKMPYALKLSGKILTFTKPKALFTRFTAHNGLYHLILDHDNWGNVNHANCKQNEKTNGLINSVYIVQNMNAHFFIFAYNLVHKKLYIHLLHHTKIASLQNIIDDVS